MKSRVLAAALLISGCGGSDSGSGLAPWAMDDAAFVTTGVVDGHPDLFLVRSREDTVWTRLTARAGLDNDPDWSPDGRRIVFHSDRDAQGQPDLDIFAIEPGSGQPAERLTYTQGFDYMAEYSPDGRHIAFLSHRGTPQWPEGSPGHVYIMDADGSNVRRVTRAPLYASLPPRWTADGTGLMYGRRSQEDGPTVLVRARLNFAAPEGTPIAQQEEVLVDDAFFNYTPTPSPDGLRLAYTAEDGEAARVVVMNADGTDRRVLVADGFNYVDEWSPDGRWIVVTRWYPAFQRRDAWLVAAYGSGRDRELLDPVHRSSSAVSFRPER